MEVALGRFHRRFDARLYRDLADFLADDIDRMTEAQFNGNERDRAVKMLLMKVDEAALWECGLGYLYNPLEKMLAEFAGSGFDANTIIAAMKYLREFEGFDAIDDINDPQSFSYERMNNDDKESPIDNYLDSLFVNGLFGDPPYIDPPQSDESADNEGDES